MVNTRRSSFSYNSNNINNQTSEIQSFSLSSILNLFKKPQAFPILLTIFIFLTWVSLRFQHSSQPSSLSKTPQRWSVENDLKANLVRFSSSQLSKDQRGWLLNPISAALNAGISGGAVNCNSVHVGEIRPGSMRGNHRHYTCNETFILWGARIKFRLENNRIPDQGYAEVIIGEDEIVVAGSPSGTAHAMVNVDPLRTAFLLGCQDGIPNYNSSGTAFNIWNDL